MHTRLKSAHSAKQIKFTVTFCDDLNCCSQVLLFSQNVLWFKPDFYLDTFDVLNLFASFSY